jgi:hypothetical protein
LTLNSRITTLGSVALALALLGAKASAQAPNFRPPAVPLITFDPYLSIWSEADHLTDDVTRHWTHHPHPLISLIQIDGATYRLMGNTPANVPAMPQVGLRTTPSQSIYEFDNKVVHVTLSFMAAVLPDDINALTRPVNYIQWKVRVMDGHDHAISIFDSASSALTVNTTNQPVEWARQTMGPLTALRAGTAAQPVLQNSGDDTRIDWGYAYLAAPTKLSTTAMGSEEALTHSFVTTGKLPAKDDTRMPRPVTDEQPTLAFEFDLGNVGAKPVTRHLMVAYDEIYAIKYFGQKLRPYWRRNGGTPASLLQEAEQQFDYEASQCEIFDKLLIDDLTALGGPKYAAIGSLAYRQCIAGTGIAADANKQPLMFTKENTSNGDIATVDVIFPMSPIWILFNPALAKASIVPILSYAASDHWKFPNAPHDLGTYPIAKGTDDGGEGMPVEESGNMLIMCDAIAQSEGNANWLKPWWPKLAQWATYLEKYGLDPEDQLCTDDFMGHLAHNANLSVKAILGLAAYGDLCRITGDTTNAAKYQAVARADADHWMKVADAGDHSLLAFDKPGTWSQKYNLVWDRILNLNVFPSSVARKEIDYYKSVLQPYGVPLDSRTHLTKTDWSLWTATMATDLDTFETLISPIYNYLNTTSARSPLVDSYITDDIKSDGMHARPVVGGLFIKMLADHATWRKWIQFDDKDKPGPWASLPVLPKVVELVPSSKSATVTWKYTLTKPADGWTDPTFDVSSWKEGAGPFGSEGTPGIAPKTIWTSDDIWLRREFTMPAFKGELQMLVYHDEDVEVYINGVLATQEAGYDNSYEPLDISPAAAKLLTPGAKIVMTVHCHQTTGGQGVDVGIVKQVKG